MTIHTDLCLNGRTNKTGTNRLTKGQMDRLKDKLNGQLTNDILMCEQTYKQTGVHTDGQMGRWTYTLNH